MSREVHQNWWCISWSARGTSSKHRGSPRSPSRGVVCTTAREVARRVHPTGQSIPFRPRQPWAHSPPVVPSKAREGPPWKVPWPKSLEKPCPFLFHPYKVQILAKILPKAKLWALILIPGYRVLQWITPSPKPLETRSNYSKSPYMLIGTFKPRFGAHYPKCWLW